MNDAADAPVLRVVAGGDPTPEELAALVVALSVRRPTGNTSSTGESAWVDRSRLLRRPLSRGPAVWRWSMR